MAKPRLVIEKKQTLRESRVSRLISIDAQNYQYLMDIKAETGQTVTAIINKFIEYGIENAEIEDHGKGV
jgi:methyltransferase-like protein